MAPSTSRRLTDRGDLVLRALAPVGANRATFVAWNAANNSTLVVGAVVDCDGISYRYTGSGAAIADLPGWVPHGMIFALHFGAKEDYDQATQAGTDDLAAIHAAFDYAASEWAPGVKGGVVWTRGRSYTSGVVTIPTGVHWRAFSPVASYGQGGTAASAWPITFNEGPGIVAGHTGGPAVLIKSDGAWLSDMTIGGTSARKAAAITSGSQTRNSGVLIETNDTTTAQIQRVAVERCLIRDQPADGVYGNGLLYGIEIRGNAIVNCGGHGVAFDDGYIGGRTNKGQPGELDIINNRINNIGGHLVLIGQPTDASKMPYRVDIQGNEGFRNGNNPAILHESAGYWICGDQVTVTSNAPGGVSGYSGVVATLDYAVWVAGRNVHFNNVRYISWVTNPVCIGQVSGVGTRGIRFTGGIASTTGANVDHFAVVEAGTYLGLWFYDLSGDFDLAPIDGPAVKALSIGGFGEYIHAQERYSWGISDVGTTPTAGFLNFGPVRTLTIAGGEITPTATRIALATEGGGAIDDLRVINGGTDGDWLILSTSQASQDVVLKQRVSGTDNIRLNGEADVTLNHSYDRISLVYREADSSWVQFTTLSDNAS